MQLLYRGVEYQYQPPQVEMAEGDVGRYRGVDIRFRYPVDKPDHRHQTNLDLIYRGAKLKA
mgnify:CR=1 FL=1